MSTEDSYNAYVHWFRNSSPYINAHRGCTFVIVFGGEAVADTHFPHLVHDIALLDSLGVRLVLVHGARPQIDERLRASGVEARYVGDRRLTDDEALPAVKDAVGSVRVDVEALLSMGLANSPMAGARIQVASGNFVTARPVGVREGIDFLHTGEVRRIDTEAINRHLDDGAIVLLSPLGYSPTGEVFNLTAEDVAAAAAAELGADKLLALVEGPGVTDTDGALIPQLGPGEAERLLARQGDEMPADVARHLAAGLTACRRGVRRVHLISRERDGALLLELFTRDGVGSMLTAETYEGLREATIDDVGGILELIGPLEADGALVRRSREHLEMEIDHFVVTERDGAIIGAGALYPFPQAGVGELACLVVHPDYRGSHRGNILLEYLEHRARSAGLSALFVLTTQTAHWFRERGFEPASVEDLPVERQALYNYQRNSKVFVKPIQG